MNDGAVCWYGSKPLIMYSSKARGMLPGNKAFTVWQGNIFSICLSVVWKYSPSAIYTMEWCSTHVLYMHTLKYNCMGSLLHKNPCSCFSTHTECPLWWTFYPAGISYSVSVRLRGVRVRGQRSVESDEVADCTVGQKSWTLGISE